MLTSMLKCHRNKQQELKRSQEEKRQDVVAALYKFNEGVLSEINSGVSSSYVNQCQIDAEMKQLQSQTIRFTKLTNQWATQLNGFYTALKEIGDVENWASGIEEDLKTVASSLEYLHKSNTTLSTQSIEIKPDA
ncbi:biogenesis of lysosome-related organelles complex 1 subunit 1-like [Clavelina lepadiformis]|uniref:Biogenesis of lysosome-related organelles complex 1 subunit 1 n=1 Tax=Clavelina lepadiformis TaxID=159417 RepID=A0ABP0H233_CLALP